MRFASASASRVYGPRPIVRRLAAVAFVTAALTVNSGVAANQAAAAIRWELGRRWYATAQSGSGTNTGVYATVYVNGRDSVPSPYGLSDEAVWLVSMSDSTALEGGFFTGVGNNVPFTTSQMAYSTINNGGNEQDYTSVIIGTPICTWMYVQTGYNGNHAKFVIAGHTFDRGSYVVTTPRLDYMQGEVGNTTCSSTMGGGVGDEFLMSYQPASYYPNNWARWGWMNTHADSPYWATQSNNYTWKNGGYGTTC